MRVFISVFRAYSGFLTPVCDAGVESRGVRPPMLRVLSRKVGAVLHAGQPSARPPILVPSHANNATPELLESAHYQY